MSKIDTTYIRQVSCRRIIWVSYVKIVTLFIPNALINYLSNERLTTKARQQAWREKLTIFCTFLLICGLFSFWMEYITYLFCDPPATYDYKEVYSNRSHLVSINGQVVDWYDLGNSSEMTEQVNLHPHSDLSAMFPTFMLLERKKQKTYSNSIINSCINGFNRSTQADNWLNHKLTHDSGYLYENDQLISCPLPQHLNETGSPCFYTVSDMQEYQRYRKKGALEFTEKGIAANYSTLPYKNSGARAFVILDSKVLDITDYLTSATNIVQIAKDTQSRSFALDRMFLPLDLTILLFVNLGQDISTTFHANIENSEIYKECLLELFYHGVIDVEDDKGCAPMNLALWATMGCFLLYSLIKMNLANLYRSVDKTVQSDNRPNLLFFIPCFTESSELVRRTFDSLARSTYEDDRKLLFFVCDGLAKNQTDSKETYLCILEALGYSSSKDPELRSYISLGQGSRRMNYAKVFAGFYESGSNRVPFLMVVKVGTPTELLSTSRVPGNRGKRDSMLIVLSFMERCMNLAHNRITPLEFEIFNQCYNVLGIDPRDIKYMLTTDSDTQVQDGAVAKMVSRMEMDPKISAISGHLKPANPEENVITMLQIFPLYITSFSGLAYEACLGKVTMLNGGFVMYRLWSQSDNTLVDQRINMQESIKMAKVSDEIIPPESFSSDDNLTTVTTMGSRQKAQPRRRLQKPRKQESQPAPLNLTPNPNISLCCIHPTVLRGFAAAEPNTMHMENVLLLGEDKYFSLVLVQSLPHHVLAFEPNAISYSVLPTRFLAFQALMIRNMRVSFHNQLEFLAMSRHLGIMYWIIAFTKLVDITFTVPLTCYLYSIYIRYFISQSLAFGIIAGSFTCLVILYIFYFSIRRQFKYILWFFVYCLLSVPILNIYFPLLAIWSNDYANQWYDIHPSQNKGSRLHGIVMDPTDNDSPESKLEETTKIRMRLGDFEILEAEKAAIREKEQAEMLDAKFLGFTGYVNSSAMSGHATKLSWSSSYTPNSLISTPPSAQVKDSKLRTGHSRFASDEDARMMLNTPTSSPLNPFISSLDDPFDDAFSRLDRPAMLHHKPSHSQSSHLNRLSFLSGHTSFASDNPIHHHRTHSNISSAYKTPSPPPEDTYNDNDSIISMNPSLVTSVITLEQDTISHNDTTFTYDYDPHRIISGKPRRPAPLYEEISEGRSAPIHSKFVPAK